MSSKRLPGKVLQVARGKPLIAYLIERLRYCKNADSVNLVTSTDREDDALAAFGEAEGIRVLRGPLDDVMGRFIDAATRIQASAFVRINGDSPLLDHRLIDRGIAEYEAAPVDLVSNAFPRSYPKGQGVEVISVSALQAVAAQTDSVAYREHVAMFFYDHPDRFRIRNFSYGRDASDIQLSVDTPEDLAEFHAILNAMERPHTEYSLDDVLQLLQANHR
ncbi:spore coat protein [Undibacter mobilis]|uniref:Spore coat protein n=2 Tax=Undibacter mobilis TaxID=2292256 RepID=A0A371B6F3_9BRAD|nr:spore coat protein [Undibacter mobilis]